jgi:hypothetical protein
MSDNDLIKQKMKAAKKNVKEKKKEANKKKVNILYGILLGILEGLGTYLITKETTWYGFAMIGYVVLYSYIFQYLLGTYLEGKKELSFYDCNLSFIFSGMISLFVICFKRKFIILAFILPIVNFCYNLLCEPNDDLCKTWYEKGILKDDGLKAVNMELKKLTIIALILGLIGALNIFGVYRYFSTEKSVFAIVLVAIIVLFIWNFIVKIIIENVSASRVKVLNCAFNLNICKKTHDYETTSFHNINIIYNYFTMYYRLFAFIFTLCIVFLFTSFNLGLTLILTSSYILICLCYPQYDNGISTTYRMEQTVATIYDKDGKIAGEIKK